MTGIGSGGIFVSYRRQDTRHVAGRVFDRLAERFGRSRVFMDVVSIEPGFDYAEAIDEAVSHCDVLLTLIGQSWLSAIDEQGRRRLDNSDDLVLLEIKAALDQDVRVIPVLVDGTPAPRRDELPEVIADLTRRNCVRLDHETFSSDVGVLMDVLERIIPPDSGRGTARPSVVVGQDDVGPDGQAENSQQSSTSAITAAPGGMSTGPTRIMEIVGAVSKGAPAALAIALAVLAVPVIAGLIVDSKRLGDTLGVLGLFLFLLMIVELAAIWILRHLPEEKRAGLRRFWAAGSTLAFLLVAILGMIVVPRLVEFWNNASLSQPAGGTSPTEMPPPASLDAGPPPRWPEGKTPILTKDVSVQAVEDWHDAGIFLNEGQTVRIVTSGQWSPFTPRLFDGRGCLNVEICSQDPNQPDNICCMPHGGLLGRIGNTNPFTVGVGTLLRVSNRGELYFRINDRVQSDNSGQLAITIQVFN